MYIFIKESYFWADILFANLNILYKKMNEYCKIHPCMISQLWEYVVRMQKLSINRTRKSITRIKATLKITYRRYRVFIKYCVFFSKILKYIPDSGLSRFPVGVSVCTHTRQVEHQRCSRAGRVQKIHNILRKKHNI